MGMKSAPLAAAALAAGLGLSAGPLRPGLETFGELSRLPLLRCDVLAHYIGSIDKRGGNADWDWWLYQDSRGEWVLAEAEGPGCLWNFVVHHDASRSDPLYKFYFDGEAEPRFSLRHTEFGAKPPFVPPLADWYGPKLRNSSDPRVDKMDFRIVRSFLPMPFKKGFRITSSEKLEGNSNPGSGAGGWGHAIFHSYASDPGIETFAGAGRSPDAVDFAKLEGGPELDGASLFPAAATLKPGASLTLFSAGGEGVVQRLRLKLKPKWSREALRDLWLRCYWEDEKEPAVNLPFGTFFGNEYGAHELKTYAFGFVPDGFSYQRLPMPFWRSARIELVNRSASGKSYEVEAETLFREGHFYERQAAGHLRASPWRPPLPGAPGQDAVVADIQGHGHAVAGVVARLGGCEGDIRVHIDGRSTPSVQSDGSESWACYGWGYYSAPEANPFSAYDGPNGDASMARSLLGDLYPFRLGLRLSAEPGCGFRTPGQGTVRTGSVFWYGEPGPGACVSDVLDVGDPASEKAHRYRALGGELFGASGFFEGAQDDVALADVGRRKFSESSFVLAVDPANEGVLLRRRASQAEGRHRAFVEVDGVRVAERAWLWPDRNPYQLWLEDEFQLPAALTAGKRELSIRIVPQELGGSVSWNECRYAALSLGSSLKASGVPLGLPGKELPPLPKGEASF